MATKKTVTETKDTKTTSAEVALATQEALASVTQILDTLTTKKTLKQKLTSRKFWASLAGLICGIIGMIGVNDNIIGIVSFAILGVGSIIAYVVTEGKIDSDSVKSTIELISQVVDKILALTEQSGTTTTTPDTSKEEETDKQ